MLRIWDVAEPNSAIIEQQDVEEDGLFSPDGHWFLADIARGTARVWNLTAPGMPAIDLPKVSKVGPFSPDGHWVLLQKTDYQSLQLLDLTDVDAQPKDLFYALGDEHWQFSSDSRWLAGAVGDLARIWNVTNPGSYPIEIRGEFEGITCLAFSMDGRRLATGTGDGSIRIYTWQVQDLIDLSCRLAGENFSQQEWKVWFGSLYRPTCPQWTLHTTS
jgi:WD40 repeat protein